MIHRVAVIILIIGAPGTLSVVVGQVPETPGAEGVRRAYEQLDFDLALARADSVIQSSEQHAPEELVEVHTIAALVLIAQNQPSAARRHFISALSIDPDLELQPMNASPQALELFRAVREETRTGPAFEETSPTRYLRIYDPRPAAAYRSMIIPGWGQVYKGQRTRGYVLMGLWGTTVAGTLAAHIIRHDRQQAYLNETDPSEVESRYDDFNRWHRIRNNLAIGAAVTWIVSYLDALIFQAPEPREIRRLSLEASYDIPARSSTPSIGLRITIP